MRLLPMGAALLIAACGSDANTITPDTMLRTYDADDANIQYTGRIDFTNPKQPRFALGGTSITAAFKGIGVSVLLKDEHRYGMWRNYYDAAVDGTVVSKIRLDDDITVIKYPVASDLPYGDHVVTIMKRTEANVGVGFFLGLEIAGEIQPPSPRPPHKMLIFGDSITAGSGVEVPEGDPGCSADGWGQPVQNADVAYGPVAARMLDAEYHVLGVAGIGLVRNFESDPTKGDTRPMPQVYRLTFPESTPPSTAIWPAASYQPDAIVIALGTNDFSPGLLNADNTPADGRPMMDPGTFATAYVGLIDGLRADYPTAHIFTMGSPMLVDGWPTAAYTSKSNLEAALGIVGDHYAAAGDTKIHEVLVSKQSGGCAAHPDVAGQAITGMELAAAVKPAMGW